MTKKNNKTPVVASPKVNISHQQSKEAAKVVKKINITETVENTSTPQKLENILGALRAQLS